MPSSKDKVLYFYTAESPFVEKDIEILNTTYEVKRFFFNIYNKKRMFRILLGQFIFLLKYSWSGKLIVCQFAGLHGFIPALFSKFFFKKSVIVSGGTDCVSFPSINYGNFSNKRNAAITGFCFKQAALILPVHESLILSKYDYQPNDYSHQGIKQFLPELKTPMTVVYNGYDGNYWHRKQTVGEGATFVTVLGHVNSKFTLLLKGIDLYVEMARKFPYERFTIIGGASLEIADKPANLELVSNIWGAAMVDVFSSHRFYVQLSISEGFPNALSEAMLCECVPIVSAVGGMPDIVGDTGYILRHKDLDELHDLFQKALSYNDPESLGKKARQKIAENYTFDKRKQKILSELNKIA
ncbi:MAG: glycosyltransferase family 4 protein [Bacteroidia bacterium]|nr:glycosyltransferase family 4 protein [Bacteroidia bacterium]